MTQRSLNKHSADIAKLRHGRSVHEGRLPEAFVGSYFPHFFSREGANLNLNGLHRGAAAFLIGGGPSFREVPRDALHRFWTITVNNGFASYRGQANCMVDDPSRFGLSMWLDPLIQKFVPMGHFEKPLWDNRLLREPEGAVQQWRESKLVVGDCPNVVGYRRNEKFHAARWLREETVNWGNHGKFGGGRSVLLATLRILFILGFRRVYLLGVDFDMSAEKKYHFEEARSEHAVRGNNETYAKLQQWLAELQPRFLKEGFIVKNCNRNSKLTAFPFMPFDEAADEATWSRRLRSRADIGHVSASRREKGKEQIFDGRRKREQSGMKFEIVSHCWHYAKMLNFQLSSLALHPPGKEHTVVYTLCFTSTDSPTDQVRRFFHDLSVPGVVWELDGVAGAPSQPEGHRAQHRRVGDRGGLGLVCRRRLLFWRRLLRESSTTGIDSTGAADFSQLCESDHQRRWR